MQLLRHRSTLCGKGRMHYLLVFQDSSRFSGMGPLSPSAYFYTFSCSGMSPNCYAFETTIIAHAFKNLSQLGNITFNCYSLTGLTSYQFLSSRKMEISNYSSFNAFDDLSSINLKAQGSERLSLNY